MAATAIVIIHLWGWLSLAPFIFTYKVLVILPYVFLFIHFYRMDKRNALVIYLKDFFLKFSVGVVNVLYELPLFEYKFDLHILVMQIE